MADSYDAAADGSYQDTETYRKASPARRRQMNRYKKENGIDDDHMFLLLFKQDLDSVPEADRTRKDTASNVMLIVGFLLLWNSLQLATTGSGQANVGLIFLSLASFCLVVAVYFLGLLNPYKRAVRRVNKQLKGRPEVPDFVEWDLAHPSKEDRKAKKGRS